MTAVELWHCRLSAAFEALDAATVRWCLLRPPSDRSAPTGDVDLLADPRDRVQVGTALRSLGFARLPNGGTPDHLFLSYDQASDRWLLLHVTWEVSFGPRLVLRTGQAEQCLRRRVRRDGVWQLDAEDAFWVTLLHVTLDKRSISTAHRVRLQGLLDPDEPAGPVAHVVNTLSPPGWSAQRVLAVVRDGQWERLHAFGLALTPGWQQQLRARVRHLARLAANLGSPWRRRGISVALLGPDGAGKSTLAEGIAGGFGLPATSLYMNVRAERLNRVTKAGLPGLAFFTYLLLLWTRLARARALQARGSLVVFDRYPYDALTAPLTDGSLKTRLARAIVVRTFPHAGMALVLDVPGSIMFARKGERSPHDLEAERQRLLALAHTLPHLVVVDASQPAEDVRRVAVEAIWQRYADRWNGR